MLLTFGLLSPNKGIEYVIEALPAILEAASERRLYRARRDASESRSRARASLPAKPGAARRRPRREGARHFLQPLRRRWRN